MNWNDWKHQYAKELEHIADYEEMFVDKILSQITWLYPNEVIPQYHFKDNNGKNRYIDFMIINETKGYKLPIELDGYAKMVGNGNDYERFNDFLYRQNEIIRLYGTILRFSNRQMQYETKRVIQTVSQALVYCRQTKENNIKDKKQIQVLQHQLQTKDDEIASLIEQCYRYELHDCYHEDNQEHISKLYEVIRNKDEQLEELNLLNLSYDWLQDQYTKLDKKYKLLKRVAYILVYILIATIVLGVIYINFGLYAY